MNSKMLILFICFFFLGETISNAQNLVAITGATVIKTNSKGVIENAVILIQDNKIIKVDKAGKVKIPATAKIIDAKGKFIIPGLIDGHIHFFQSGGLYTRPDGLNLQYRVPYSDERKWIKDNVDDVFKRYIRCGVTTVIDMGGPMWNFDVRKYSETANISPRVFVAGPLIASYCPKVFNTEDPPIIKVTTIDSALLLVKKQVEAGTDFIKIWYVVTKEISAEDFYPVVKAVVDEAHKNGLKCYIHATELNTAKKSMEAGCDVLVHNVKDADIDEEFLKLAKLHKVIIIPTMWVFESYNQVYAKQLKLMKIEQLLGNPKVIGSLYDMYELNDSDLGDRQKKLIADTSLIRLKPCLFHNLKKMQDAGITIAAGTDAGNVGVLHGPGIFHEFAYMAQAGLTNYEILIDATLNGAKLLNKEKTLGSIDAGKFADLVILNSNPLTDIQNTTDIYLVIKDGKIFEPDKVLPYTPTDLAQIQLNAYNAKDVESFMAVYSDSVQVFTFPNTPDFEGKIKMKELYTSFFNRAGTLHCKIINRISYKNYVLDQEEVTTQIPGREKFEGQAIYKIEGGKIQKVWFLK